MEEAGESEKGSGGHVADALPDARWAARRQQTPTIEVR